MFFFSIKKPNNNPFVDFHFRNSTQVSSSQISRFFTHSKVTDETHRKTENSKTQNQNNNESGDCSTTATAAVIEKATTTATATTPCNGNDSQPVCTFDDKLSDKPDAKKSHGNKRKHGVKCDTRSDSKSTIKSFFTNELNDSLADFEAPNKVVKKRPKVLPPKVVKVSRSRRKQQPDIRKALSKEDAACDNYSHLPEDAQLELALAISKAESMNGIPDDASSSSTSSSAPIDLNAFAFQPANSKSSNCGDVLNFFNLNRKTKTKARFKWNTKCTQLTRRDDDTQKSKVRDKINEILLNNIIVESSQADRLKSSEEDTDTTDTIDYSPHSIHSRRLQRICVSERILFELNNCDKNTKSNLRPYYTNNLVEACEAGAETLLKDWSRIPGRDSIYDGVQNAANEPIETDAIETVIPSSPEYDIQTESSLSEIDDDGKGNDQLENTIIVSDDQHQADTAGCSNMNQSGSAMDMESDTAVQDVDDQDRTLIMNFDDIQSKIDAINSNIRLSQQFCDTYQASDFTCQAATTTRTPSPDLFDDDDDDETGCCADNDLVISDENRKMFWNFLMIFGIFRLTNQIKSFHFRRDK